MNDIDLAQRPRDKLTNWTNDDGDGGEMNVVINVSCRNGI